MKPTLMRAAIGAALALSGFVHAARAQVSTGMDLSAMPEYRAEFDRAAKNGVPMAPLMGTVRRGMNDNIPTNKIRDAVRGTVDRYIAARDALNPVQGNAELDAGADAIQVGIPKAWLQKMRAAHKDRSLAVPLGALQILVTKGVSAKNALATVEKMLTRRDSDVRIASLGNEMQGYLATGLAPSDAFDALSRSVLSLPQSPAAGSTLSPQRK